MPQGSDFYQKQLRKDLRDNKCAEKAFEELEKVTRRVRELEAQVRILTNRLDVLEGKGPKLNLG